MDNHIQHTDVPRQSHNFCEYITLRVNKLSRHMIEQLYQKLSKLCLHNNPPSKKD